MVIKIVNKTKRGEVQSARYFTTLPTAIKKLTTMSDFYWHFDIGDYHSDFDYIGFNNYEDVEKLVDDMYCAEKSGVTIYDVVARIKDLAITPKKL